MIKRLNQEVEILIDTVISLSYFMRGGATYEEIMRMTPGERDKVARFVEKRLESQKDRIHPVY